MSDQRERAKRRRALLAANKRYERERLRNLTATPGPHSLVMVLDHLKAAHNVPKIIRTAEAFGAAGVHLIGIGPFDPAAAKGAFKKVPARIHESFTTSHASLVADGYRIFALTPRADGAVHETTFPERTAFVVGHEEFGFHFDLDDFPDVGRLAIAQWGQTESLNVSNAAAIAMYEYVRQHGKPDARPAPHASP